MKAVHRAVGPAAFAAVLFSPVAARAESQENPLRFFEGVTEGVSTVKQLLKKPFRARTVGHGTIGPDGSLELVQQVEEEGKPPKSRRWHIRQVVPGRYSGTMSEASSPVVIEAIDGRYRFRFRIRGSLAVEQWLTPLPGGRSARSALTVRKLGVAVARSEGLITRIR